MTIIALDYDESVSSARGTQNQCVMQTRERNEEGMGKVVGVLRDDIWDACLKI